MTIFVIIEQPGTDSEKLLAAIERQYSEDFLKIQDDTWLIATKGTAQEVSEKIGLNAGGNGAAIVAAISTYYGRASPNIWDWMKKKWESTSG